MLRTANFNDGTLHRLRARQRRLGGLGRGARRRRGLARQGRRRGLLRRPDPAGLLRDPRAGARAEADRRLERERLRASSTTSRRPTSSSPASTSRSTRPSSATARRRAGSSTRRASSPAASGSDTYYDMQVVVNGLVVTVLVNGANVLSKQLAPALHRRPALRPQHGPRRRRLEQLARHLRQLHRAGAAAAVVVREHRGLHRRRRRPLHRRPAPAPGRSPPAATPARRRSTAAATSVMTPAGARAPATRTVDVDVDDQARRAAARGGLVFDYYRAERLQVRRARPRRRAPSSSATGSGTSGSSTRRFTTPLAAGVDYKLSLSLNGTTVTVSLNGTALGSFSYNGAVADGGLGTISRTGTTSFDNVHVDDRRRTSSNSPDSQPPTLTVPANVTRATDPGKATAIDLRLDARHRDRDRQRRRRLARPLGRAGREHLPDRRDDDHLDGDRRLRQPDRSHAARHRRRRREARARRCRRT